MLTGDGGQHGQRGREAQLLNLEVPPPEGRGQARESVNRETSENREPAGGVQPGEGLHMCRWGPGTRVLSPAHVVSAQRCPHHGLFTEISSSFMKPFCSIHLSLRNLDLQHQKPQGWAEGLNTTPAPKEGRGPQSKPRPHLSQTPQSSRDPKGLAGGSTKRSEGWMPERPPREWWSVWVSGQPELNMPRAQQKVL